MTKNNIVCLYAGLGVTFSLTVRLNIRYLTGNSQKATNQCKLSGHLYIQNWQNAWEWYNTWGKGYIYTFCVWESLTTFREIIVCSEKFLFSLRCTIFRLTIYIPTKNFLNFWVNGKQPMSA